MSITSNDALRTRLAQVTTVVLTLLVGLVAVGLWKHGAYSAQRTSAPRPTNTFSPDAFRSWPSIRVQALDNATMTLSTAWRHGRLFYRFSMDRYPRAVRIAGTSSRKGGLTITFNDGDGLVLVTLTIPRSDLRRVNDGWLSSGTLEATGDMALEERLYRDCASWNIAWLVAGRPPIVVAQQRSQAGSDSSELAANPRRVRGATKPPVRTVTVEPVYPAIAREAGIHGIVIVEITIGTTGKVTDVRVLRSLPLLDQAAVDAVKQWEFQPSISSGVPVPVVLTVPISFK